MLSFIILIMLLFRSCENQACIDLNNKINNIDTLLDNCDCKEVLVKGCMDRKYKEYNPKAHIDDGSCKTKKEGEELIDCPERELVFQVCNSNAKIDDNFQVYLNDVYIGKLTLNRNEQLGSVFIATTENFNISDPDFKCSMKDMEIYRFDPSIIKYGSNTLVLENTQRNNNGNFGSIGLRTYLIDNMNLVSPCTIEDFEYNGSSGKDFNFKFNYTDCCP